MDEGTPASDYEAVLDRSLYCTDCVFNSVTALGHFQLCAAARLDDY